MILVFRENFMAAMMFTMRAGAGRSCPKSIVMGPSKKYCHAELVSASLVQERFRVRPGMTAAAGSE